MDEVNNKSHMCIIQKKLKRFKRNNYLKMKEDSDIYSGFEDNISQIYNYDASQDEAFLNAVKVSSYGKKVATPKFYYVIMHYTFSWIKTKTYFFHTDR